MLLLLLLPLLPTWLLLLLLLLVCAWAFCSRNMRLQSTNTNYFYWNNEVKLAGGVTEGRNVLVSARFRRCAAVRRSHRRRSPLRFAALVFRDG